MRIVLHSFEGRYSDNPRALYERLIANGTSEHELVWLLDPAHAEAFPADTRTEQYGTPEARRRLERADLVISNTHLDLEWDKPAGARYLQTWHGTPLKRIHHDVLWAPEGRLERLDRDVARWDLLLSPNAPSTPLLRRAFRFEGDLAETGYPRNDVLAGPGAGARRDAVREALGIPGDRVAVLYAPTWRDDTFFPEGGKDFSLALDTDAFQERLGSSHVLLLRLHYTQTGRLAAGGHASVKDVSWHPDIAELYLAADVLVTDYSSTMFDFGVTRRPQVLFTYDLEDYRDRLRGFYFELEPIAPGPLVTTTEELLDALAGLDEVAARYAEREQAFFERFCHLEDGRAADRVLDLVLAHPRT